MMQDDQNQPRDDHHADAEESNTAIVGLTQALTQANASLSKIKGQVKIPFGYGPRCTKILGIGYVLAWITFGLTALGELFVLWLLIVGDLHEGDASSALWILAAGPLALLNSFIWIVVLARVRNLERPVLATESVSLPPTRKSRDPDGINVDDFPDVRYNNPADVAAILTDQNEDNTHEG
jgi:hypothetical protein